MESGGGIVGQILARSLQRNFISFKRMNMEDELMDQSLSEEEIARIKELYPVNTVEHIKRVRRLLKHAKPGNIPWRILENDYGFDGDYISGQDEGEPPQGANW